MAHSGSFCRGELKNSNLHNGHTAHITSLRNIVQQRYIIIRIEIYSMGLDSNYKQLRSIADSLFLLLPFLFFFLFLFFSAALFDQANCKQCIHARFTDLQILFFSHFFIKNESHDTIYTFKNYFITVFSVSIFSSNKNKLNPNGS